MITINDALNRNAVAPSIMTVDLQGSDYRSLSGKRFGAHRPGVAWLAKLAIGPKVPNFSIRLANSDAFV